MTAPKTNDWDALNGAERGEVAYTLLRALNGIAKHGHSMGPGVPELRARAGAIAQAYIVALAVLGYSVQQCDPHADLPTFRIETIGADDEEAK